MKKLLLGMALLLMAAPAFAEKVMVKVLLVHENRAAELMRKMGILFAFEDVDFEVKDSDQVISNTQTINEHSRMTCTIIHIENDRIEYTIELCLKDEEGQFQVFSTSPMVTEWGQEAVDCISETDSADERLLIVAVAQKDANNAIIEVDDSVVDADNRAREEAVTEQGEVVSEEAVTEEVVAEEVVAEEVAN